MNVLDPGHKYSLDCLDDDYGLKILLIFVKREGEKYPGNKGHYSGTNLQEVMRALIDRTEYLNNQIPDTNNRIVIERLRECIWLLEERAARRHCRPFTEVFANIELLPTCKVCGHIGCTEH